MKNILFISIYPFPVNMGSKQHAFYFIKSLAENNNVHCLFFIPPHQHAPLDANTDLKGLGIKSYELCHFNAPVDKQDGYRKFFRDLKAFPNSFVKLATHPEGLNKINSAIAGKKIDIVHFEHFWLSKYAFLMAPKLKKVLVYHDLHHSIYKQLVEMEKKLPRKLAFLMEAIKFYIYEHLLDAKVALKIFLNPVEMLSLPKKSVHIPHVVNPDIHFKPARQTNIFNLLFLGAYSHPPNRRSAAFIVNDILPRLADGQLNFVIHFIGPGTEGFQSMVDASSYREQVVIHGFKEDINDAFENMDIALFPILNGGGIKTKIIDALAAGVPVVTTPKGIEGLAGLPEDAVGVASTAEALVLACRHLMQSYPLRMQRSGAGKHFIDHEHSFHAFSQKVNRMYSQL